MTRLLAIGILPKMVTPLFRAHFPYLLPLLRRHLLPTFPDSLALFRRHIPNPFTHGAALLRIHIPECLAVFG